MASFRFIHTADLHLDSPFKGLRHLPKQIVSEIYESTFRSFDRIVEYCIEKEVDFLLIAGDVYDLEVQSLRAQIYLKRSLEKLNQHGIHTFIIHGNHDPIDQQKAQIKWPERVHFFSGDRVEGISFLKENKEIARIVGRSYPMKAFMENIVKDYHRQNPNLFHIGLLHTNVDGQQNHDPYCPSRLQELISGEMDYWALGHIHKQMILHRGPYVIYPGNPQGRHIQETGDKGCYYVEVVDNEVQSIQWLSTAQIRWETIELDISQITTIDDLINLIEMEIEERLIQIKRPMLTRVILKGQTSLHILINEEDQRKEIEEVLNVHLIEQQPWAWIETIQAGTQPPISIEKIGEQGSFLADYLSQIEHFFKKMDTETIKKEILSELFRHRGIKKHFSSLTNEDMEEIKNQIINYAYEYLLGKE
ncbi:metallophosphoesterase family protein [Tepidibacillus fermentans]|uniref:DNA repair exonuclease SbcCD nuclease subunit n=1 Tax=Tepidibacillus fermentans TaxID=1281767 RepID=A0A4R3KL11_9BACI|nr:DNA repair exonuclease [Tepidibacillus fermentans]TCS84190.1 DNA repair exonuclease SbcCD nuclease subunit [Tepidibacillus fermentans]